MSGIYLLIFGMLLVTYIPRVAPAFLADRLTPGRRLQKYLELIPYTAMASLIFPGVLSVDGSYAVVGAVGAIVAVGLSLIKKVPISVVVIGAVAADMLVYAIIK